MSAQHRTDIHIDEFGNLSVHVTPMEPVPDAVAEGDPISEMARAIIDLSNRVKDEFPIRKSAKGRPKR